MGRIVVVLFMRISGIFRFLLYLFLYVFDVFFRVYGFKFFRFNVVNGDFRLGKRLK